MHGHFSRAARGAGVACVLAGLAWIAAPIQAGGAKLKEGDPAPDIDLQATNDSSIFPDKKDGKSFKLSDLKGKKNVVLWFYPKALTGG